MEERLNKEKLEGRNEYLRGSNRYINNHIFKRNKVNWNKRTITEEKYQHLTESLRPSEKYPVTTNKKNPLTRKSSSNGTAGPYRFRIKNQQN